MPRRGLATSLRARPKKTNNHPAAFIAKSEIRRFVLDGIGAAEARVFDAYAGEGQLYRAVWQHAASYVGCDLKWYRDGRTAYVADNRRVMRAIDLGQFSIFDFDAWGSPWELAMILCTRRRLSEGERLGLVLTEGSGLGVKLGAAPIALALLSGVRPTAISKSRGLDEVVDRAIRGLATRLGGTVVRRWEARGKTGARMRYIGLLIEGTKKAAGAEAQAA